MSYKTINKPKLLNTSTIVITGLLAALSIVLMQFELPLPMFPDFLKIDASDLPSVIGALAFGPAVGVLVELIKNLLHLLLQTKTGGIGELANFVVGSAYMVPLGFIFARSKNIKNFVFAACIATLSMVVIASVANYLFIIPAYSNFYGAPIDAFVGMANKVNGNVTSFKTLIVFAIAPFNLIKCVLISILGYLLYNPLKPILHKSFLKKG